MPALPEPLQQFDGIADALAESLARLDALAARYRGLKHAGGILPNVVEALRIELTYHSNAIEGNTLTLRETQLVIEGQSPGEGKSLRELYEARNHHRAVKLVEEWVATRGDTAAINHRDLLDLHAIVLADIDSLYTGRFRDGRVLIAGTGFVPPASGKFDQLIGTLIELSNRRLTHPVLEAAELHYNLVAVHPFNDGNGRTARLMMNYHLARHGFPPAIIEVGRRKEYLTALDAANAGHLEPFAGFIVDSLAHTVERYLT